MKFGITCGRHLFLFHIMMGRQKFWEFVMKQVIFVLLLFVANIACAEKPGHSNRHMDSMKSFMDSMQQPFHTQRLQNLSFKSSSFDFDLSWRPKWRLMYVEEKFYCDLSLGKDSKRNLLFIEGRFDLR